MATLMLVQQSPKPLELDPVDLDSLLKQEFVTLDTHLQGKSYPRLTSRGMSLLSAMDRMR
jgi:hypothetical protein